MGTDPEYMQHSTKCLRLAQQASDPGGAFVYVLMAHAWMTLTRQVSNLKQRSVEDDLLKAALAEVVRKLAA